MKLADIQNAFGSGRDTYAFHLNGGSIIQGRVSNVPITNDLLIVHYTKHYPPGVEHLRVLINVDAIQAIEEL